MSESIKGVDPKKRRAMVSGLIARARANPTQPELIDEADVALNAAGPKDKSQMHHLANTLNNAAYEVWVANGSSIITPTQGRHLLTNMIQAGERDIVIVTRDVDQARHARSYRSHGLSSFKEADSKVRIIIDLHQRIPTGGLRGATSRVINYYWKHQ